MDFNTFINQFNTDFNEFNLTQVFSSVSFKKYEASINNEDFVICISKSNLTGSDRPKPQIRVFTENIQRAAEEALTANKRFFCLVHCSHTKVDMKFSNLTPHEYIVSLESNWIEAGERIDIRSVYDYVEANYDQTFKKLTNSEHNVRTVNQAAVFKFSTQGISILKEYLKYFDNRVLLNNSTNSDQIISASTLSSTGINKIFFGAPGTGKSYGIEKFIQDNGISDYDISENHPNVFRTTLHPEYTYYDFVGQIMPITTETASHQIQISYDFAPGIFTKALENALLPENSEKPIFLILEEMSRANVSAVFGDIFQLLDRNIETGISDYGIHNELISKYLKQSINSVIRLPKNLFIIGTVNTNDQNVFIMDTAFKRRFEFEYINANDLAYDEDGDVLNNFEFTLNGVSGPIHFKWIDLYRVINKFITTKIENGGLGLKEDKQLGQFFIKFKVGSSQQIEDYNCNLIQNKLLQYLYDDIESSTYNGISIFNKNINNFSEAYNLFKVKDNIFSDELLIMYEQFINRP